MRLPLLLLGEGEPSASEGHVPFRCLGNEVKLRVGTRAFFFRKHASQVGQTVVDEIWEWLVETLIRLWKYRSRQLGAAVDILGRTPTQGRVSLSF